MTLSRRNVLFLPVVPLALSACQRGVNVLEVTGSTMGTTFNVVAVDHDNAVDDVTLRRRIDVALAEVNAQLSNWDAASEVSQFNAARSTQAMPVSVGLETVMRGAQDVHLASQGQFDVTLGPLIELWGFGAGEISTHVPSDADIAAVLEGTGQRHLTLGDSTLRKDHAGAEVFVSAIGKGYGVDRVARELARLGLTDYMVEIGGDLVTAGLNPEGRAWQIGIEQPEIGLGGLHSVASLSGLGMATSGDYRNYFEQDGVRFSHILNAQTGRPVTHQTASATVLTNNAMMADAWATAMLILGSERGLEIAEAQNLAVAFIDRAGTGFVTTTSTQFAELQA